MGGVSVGRVLDEWDGRKKERVWRKTGLLKTPRQCPCGAAPHRPNPVSRDHHAATAYKYVSQYNISPMVCHLNGGAHRGPLFPHTLHLCHSVSVRLAYGIFLRINPPTSKRRQTGLVSGSTAAHQTQLPQFNVSLISSKALAGNDALETFNPQSPQRLQSL